MKTVKANDDNDLKYTSGVVPTKKKLISSEEVDILLNH